MNLSLKALKARPKFLVFTVICQFPSDSCFAYVTGPADMVFPAGLPVLDLSVWDGSCASMIDFDKFKTINDRYGHTI
jgi:hypothetical protein